MSLLKVYFLSVLKQLLRYGDVNTIELGYIVMKETVLCPCKLVLSKYQLSAHSLNPFQPELISVHTTVYRHLPPRLQNMQELASLFICWVTSA